MHSEKRFSRQAVSGVIAAIAVAVTMLVFVSAAQAAPWKFAVLCDDRASYATDAPEFTNSPYYSTTAISPYFASIAQALSKETDIDLVVFPGDLVRGKKPALSGAQMAAGFDLWKTYMQPVYDAGIPVYLLRGNHDATQVSDPAGSNGNAMAIWKAKFPVPSVAGIDVTDDASQSGLSYAFEHKGSLFVALDEYAAGTNTYDQAFLQSQLARGSAHKFVFAHQPLWNYKADELGPAGMAADLKAGQVDLFFSGHVHSYQRIREKGFRFDELIVGTGGAPQDNPTLPGDATYTADPNLSLMAYAGGPGLNARMGYVIVTVNDDGTLSSELKAVNYPGRAETTVSSYDLADVTPSPVARCKDKKVYTVLCKQVNISINSGSYDIDGLAITGLTQNPAGPYSVGVTPVQLTVTNSDGASSTCLANVTVANLGRKCN